MDKEGKLILVTGATGMQGGAVVRHLIKNDWPVRGLTRDPSKPEAQKLADLGVEVVKGDFDDAPSLLRALEGVYGVFAMGTPYEEGPEAETRQGYALADAAKAANVSHYVYSSVGSAHLNTGIPHFDSKWKVERHIEELGLPATVVRPVFFMENFAWGDWKEGIDNGTLAMPLPGDRPLQILAVDDIGYFVGLAFDHPDEYLGKAFDLAGDEPTMPDVAAKFTAVKGHDVAYTPFPLENMMDQNPDWGLMFKWFDEVGYSADIEGLREVKPDLIDLDHWLDAGRK